MTWDLTGAPNQGAFSRGLWPFVGDCRDVQIHWGTPALSFEVEKQEQGESEGREGEMRQRKQLCDHSMRKASACTSPAAPPQEPAPGGDGQLALATEANLFGSQLRPRTKLLEPS